MSEQSPPYHLTHTERSSRSAEWHAREMLVPWEWCRLHALSVMTMGRLMARACEPNLHMPEPFLTTLKLEEISGYH